MWAQAKGKSRGCESDLAPALELARASTGIALFQSVPALLLLLLLMAASRPRGTGTGTIGCHMSGAVSAKLRGRPGLAGRTALPDLALAWLLAPRGLTAPETRRPAVGGDWRLATGDSHVLVAIWSARRNNAKGLSLPLEVIRVLVRVRGTRRRATAGETTAETRPTTTSTKHYRYGVRGELYLATTCTRISYRTSSV
eukprot:scaffold34933_cov46-Prasinocladus_malaysianus.AAC.2